MESISKKENAIMVSYEKLLKYPEQEMKALCLRVGLDYSSHLLEVEYKKNTFKAKMWFHECFIFLLTLPFVRFNLQANLIEHCL